MNESSSDLAKSAKSVAIEPATIARRRGDDRFVAHVSCAITDAHLLRDATCVAATGLGLVLEARFPENPAEATFREPRSGSALNVFAKFEAEQTTLRGTFVGVDSGVAFGFIAAIGAAAIAGGGSARGASWTGYGLALSLLSIAIGVVFFLRSIERAARLFAKLAPAIDAELQRLREVRNEGRYR